MTSNTDDKSGAPPTIHIKISSQTNEDIVFKVKTSTTFEKILEKYCDRFNIKNKGQVRFLHDGIKIDFSKSPSDLNLEDGDIVECVTEQEGGAAKGPSQSSSSRPGPIKLG